MTYHSLGRAAALTLVLLFASVSAAFGQSDPDSSASSSAAKSETASVADPGSTPAESKPVLSFGINGHYRLGHMTTVRLAGPRNTIDGPIVLETLDGDGVRVRYHNDDVLPIADGKQELGLINAGSEAAPVAVRRLDDGQFTTVAQARLPESGNPARGPSVIPPSMPWVVSIGDALGIETLGTSNVLTDKLARIAVTTIDSAGSLPHQQLGYDGVDLVIINAAGLDVVGKMNDRQSDAFVGWIRSGGRCFVSLGEQSQALLDAAPWLISLLPIDEVELNRYDPAAFETYTSSQTPLDVFRGIKLPRRDGKPLLLGRTTRRVSAVLIAEYAIGLGKITAITADLESPLFAEWPERMSLVTQAIGDLFTEQNDRNSSADNSTTFNDLAGQMRGVLDQFDVKRQFDFSVVSLIVLILIAAIGPLDYLLINRVLGKPLLGWVTFPVFAIALSVFLILQSSPRADVNDPQSPTSSLVRANQFQITDLDFVDGAGRSFLWSSIYTHHPIKADVAIRPSDELTKMIQTDSDHRTQSISYPFGYPGKVFGGIQLVGENGSLLPYEVIPANGGQPNDANNNTNGAESLIEQVTIAPRSSKSIASKQYFAADTSGATPVIRRPGSDLLRGDFVNPLTVDLIDAVLIYRNTVYLLPTRVPAGKPVKSIENVRQRNFRWRLTRKVSLEDSATESTPWSPADFGDIERVADMLLFHQAAGGKLYTGLRHDILGDLDLSETLLDNRCILVAKTEQPLVQMNLVDRSTEEPRPIASVETEKVLSMVRVVLPVRSTLLTP
ncbi:hypothetical protein [Roseiconus lacunae]|uniref:hypothetical protein n=1 Tax=Roseiconus lacunae TaxID=2605694 RepID=UPI0011F18E70|nr:hypothetical protein [Roseiconus lacunae]